MRRFPLLEPDFLLFFGRMVFRVPTTLWEASKSWVTFTGIVTFYLTFSPKLAEYGLSVFGNICPLWALAPVGLLFLLGLMWAPFEEYRRLQAERDQERAEKKALEQWFEIDEKRRILKTLLGEAIDEGRILQRMLRREEPNEVKRARLPEIDLWVDCTSELIEVAFDKGEAQLFLRDQRRTTGVRRRVPAFYISEIEAWLKRLYELIPRADTIPMRPDFDPQDWGV